jgi:hypothetical protein
MSNALWNVTTILRYLFLLYSLYIGYYLPSIGRAASMRLDIFIGPVQCRDQQILERLRYILPSISVHIHLPISR